MYVLAGAVTFSEEAECRHSAKRDPSSFVNSSNRVKMRVCVTRTGENLSASECCQLPVYYTGCVREHDRHVCAWSVVTTSGCRFRR